MSTNYAMHAKTGDADWDQYWEWLDLCEEGDAEAAWQPDNVSAMNDFVHHIFDLDDITDVREIRSIGTPSPPRVTPEGVYTTIAYYQWCRIRPLDEERYEWRWIVCLPPMRIGALPAA